MQIGPIDIRDPAVARDVLRVQRAAYAVEAARIGFDGIPALHESVEALSASEETFLGARVDGRLAGLVAWRRHGDVVDVHRLVVDPPAARRGIGRALLRAALAAVPPDGRAVVSTAAANAPALRLYAAEGFLPVRERPVAPGVIVCDLERRAG